MNRRIQHHTHYCNHTQLTLASYEKANNIQFSKRLEDHAINEHKCVEQQCSLSGSLYLCSKVNEHRFDK